LKALGPGAPETRATGEDLAVLLERQHRADEASRVRDLLAIPPHGG
jgi:hypothetical protein